MIPNTPQRLNLFAFVTLKHFGQKRKYTNEPYVNHLRAVAEIADGKCKFGYEIGLCHDLLEDTDCTPLELRNALERFGYSFEELFTIGSVVSELTDMYTYEKYPDLNRKIRKQKEACRLHFISYEGQTVKYCDIINNSESILKHDQGFAKIYIPELKMILDGMNKGNKKLYKLALKSIEYEPIKKIENV